MMIFKFLKMNDNYIDFCISIIFIYFFYLFKFIEVIFNFYFLNICIYFLKLL